MLKKIRKKFKKVNSQKGFTLLEILVVLTIMGFLIAMVAPRLAGIGNSAVDTICDTNQNRMMTYLSTYFQQTDGSLPNNMTNLVYTDGTGASIAYAIPKVSDEDPDTGPEVLSAEFDGRNHFVKHELNSAEIAELAELGITDVYNLNDYAPDSSIGPTVATKSGFMTSVKTDSDNFAVAMVGIGAAAAATDAFATVPGVTEREWGEPKWFARIVFGLGSECDLITSGIIINAAHCPGGLQNADNATYNDYNLVVPRLKATADRLKADTLFGSAGDVKAITAIAYNAPDLADLSATYSLIDNDDAYKLRTFNLVAQEGWEYETQCPEGHMYPEENDFWAIDLGTTADVID